jgi:hypothetical protein
MASLNDFKILNKKCEKYFSYLIEAAGIESGLQGVEAKRLGFYVFILENVCQDNDSDIDMLIESIIDTQFNYFLKGTKDDDCGMDAVFIDEKNKVIRFFNFKFRDKFNPDSRQHLNDNFTSSKFLNVIKSEKTKGIKGKPLIKAKEVIARLNSNDEWELILYQVSNESQEAPVIDSHIQNLMDCYDLKVKTIGLPSISEMMSIRPKPISASLVIEKEAIMSFSADNIESAKSYITRINSADIIRITSNSEIHRNNHNIEDIQCLSTLDIDYGVLFDNVRGFVMKSKYNPNIIQTLEKDPNKFFMYNNGITIVAKNIEGKKINGDKRVKLEIEDFQILNGGQTVRSIHKFNKLDPTNVSKYLAHSEVLVRIFKANGDDNEINRIAEYTNSQNSIKPSDLKSLSVEQIEIERYLEEHQIIYARKSGDTGDLDKNYKHKITMAKFGQILTAIQGKPERSTNSIQDIFEKYYKELFIDNFNITDSPMFIEKYFEIIREYKASDYKGMQLKYFYILFLQSLNVIDNYSKMIDFFETFLKEFHADQEMSDVRKMGLTKFRQDLEKSFKTNT